MPSTSAVTVTVSAVQEQLQRILSWSSFQNSRRYPKFLKYVVEKAVSGTAEDLKERVIGVEVFERPTDYEPATDPVVRLVAGEIRKRLAQYYLQPEHAGELRIEIPLGSYVPVFRWPPLSSGMDGGGSEEEAAFSPVAHPTKATVSIGQRSVASLTQITPRTRTKVLLAAALSVIAATVLFTFWWIHEIPNRQLNAFWKPILTSGTSTMICVGDWANPSRNNNDRFVGPTDLAVSERLSRMLTDHGRQFSVVMSSNVTLSDLRAQPDILIGAANNKWTPVILANARFQFRSIGDSKEGLVTDTQASQERDWTIQPNDGQEAMHINQAVGLISRVSNPMTGQVELVLAGITGPGTIAATDFVTTPGYFRQFTSQAPKGWERRDIQILVGASVINRHSGPPQMLSFDVR